MSRFGTGLGFNIQDIALISGIATEIFTANVASFDGAGYFRTGTTGNSLILTNLTYSAWVKLKTTSPVLEEIIIANAPEPLTAEGTIRIGYDFSANYLTFVTFNAGWYLTASDVLTINDDTWHHIGVTKQGLNITFYVDGVEAGTGVHGNSASTQSNTSYFLGSFQGLDQSDRYRGGMAYPRVHKRAGTSSDFTNMFNGGQIACTDLLDPSIKTDLIYAPSLASYVGNAGQELVNEGSEAYVTSNIGTTPFTGSAQIECEA
jgi:hypothetical protein